MIVSGDFKIELGVSLLSAETHNFACLVLSSIEEMAPLPVHRTWRMPS